VRRAPSGVAAAKRLLQSNAERRVDKGVSIATGQRRGRSGRPASKAPDLRAAATAAVARAVREHRPSRHPKGIVETTAPKLQHCFNESPFVIKPERPTWVNNQSGSYVVVESNIEYQFETGPGAETVFWPQPTAAFPIGYVTVPNGYEERSWMDTPDGVSPASVTGNTMQTLFYFLTTRDDTTWVNAPSSCVTAQWWHSEAGAIPHTIPPWSFVSDSPWDTAMCFLGGTFSADVTPNPLHNAHVGVLGPTSGYLYGSSSPDCNDKAYSFTSDYSQGLRQVSRLRLDQYQLLNSFTGENAYTGPDESNYPNVQFNAGVNYVITSAKLFKAMAKDVVVGSRSKTYKWDLHTKDRVMGPLINGKSTYPQYDPPVNNTPCDSSMFCGYRNPTAPFCAGQGIMSVRNLSADEDLVTTIRFHGKYMVEVSGDKIQLLMNDPSFKLLNGPSEGAKIFGYCGSQVFSGVGNGSVALNAAYTKLCSAFPSGNSGTKATAARMAVSDMGPQRVLSRTQTVKAIDPEVAVNSVLGNSIVGTPGSPQSGANSRPTGGSGSGPPAQAPSPISDLMGAVSQFNPLSMIGSMMPVRARGTQKAKNLNRLAARSRAANDPQMSELEGLRVPSDPLGGYSLQDIAGLEVPSGEIGELAPLAALE
jgi:hypothetical protein